MLVNGRSGFRLGGRNDGLGVMGRRGRRGVPHPRPAVPPSRAPFAFPQDRLRTNGPSLLPGYVMALAPGKDGLGAGFPHAITVPFEV